LIHLIIYLLFSIIIAEMTLSTLFDDDSLGTSIRHFTLDQFVTSLERSLNVLELNTFYDTNCQAGRDDFNGSDIMEKGEDLTQQMH